MFQRSRLFAFAGLLGVTGLAGFVALSYRGASASAVHSSSVTPAKKVLAPQVPLWFERNTDEYPAQVLYASRSMNQTVYLTASEMVLATSDGSALSIAWKNGNPARVTKGQDALKARVDYFGGKDRSKWRAGDVARYGKVRYEQIYSGVDLVFHPEGSQLEHDFVVAPGADPKQIALSFSGASSMKLESDGSLALQVGSSQVRQSKPVAYQQIDGQRVEVAANFRLSGEQEAVFELGSYDPAHELVIDPVLQYSTYLGGSSYSSPTSVVTDPATGIVWISGTTTSTDFPIIGTTIRDTGFGGRDIFIAQIDPSKAGSESLLYAAFVGGTGSDEARSMVVDKDGNAVIAGTTTSGDFPIVGSYDTTIENLRDGVILKIDPRRGGSDALVYTTFIGGDNDDFVNAVTTDSQGKIIVAGYTVSDNFPQTANSIQSNRQSGYELFIAKIDPEVGTNGLIYSTYYGGSGTDIPRAVAVDAQGLIYVAGSTTSENFPIGDNAYQPAYRWAGDMFLIRVDPNKAGITGINYGTYIGGIGIDSAEAIALGTDGSVYLTGYTTSDDLPWAGNAPQRRIAGGADAYVMRLNLTNNEVLFATYLGGTSTDIAYGMNVDTAGRIHIAGYTYSTNFNVTRNALQASGASIPDAFMASFNPALPASESLLYSSYIGSAGLDYAYAVTSNNNCLVSVAGSTTGKRFPVNEKAYQGAASGFPDLFLSSVNICQ